MLFIQRHVYQVSTFFGKRSVHMPESDESAWQRMGTSWTRAAVLFFDLEKHKREFFFPIIYTHANIAQFPPLHPHQRLHFPFLKPHGFILQFSLTQLHCSGAILFGGVNVYSARFKHKCHFCVTKIWKAAFEEIGTASQNIVASIVVTCALI